MDAYVRDMIEQPAMCVEYTQRQSIGYAYTNHCYMPDGYNEDRKQAAKESMLCKLAPLLKPGQAVEVRILEHAEKEISDPRYTTTRLRLDYVVLPQPQLTARREVAYYQYEPQSRPVAPALLQPVVVPKMQPPKKTGIAKVFDDFWQWHKSLTDYL